MPRDGHRAPRTVVDRTRRWAAPAVVVLALAGLVACGSPTTGDSSAGVVIRRTSDPSGLRGAVVPYEKPDVTLTDTAGAPFDLESDTTAPITLYFFGYTHCPDVCGIVMAAISSALRRVDPAVRAQTEVVYVTTDPPRDTPEVLAEYLSRYDFESVTGVTGEMKDIEDAGLQLGVEIADGKKLPGGGYEVTHSAHVIGFGPDGTSVIWTQGTPVEDMAYDLERLAAR